MLPSLLSACPLARNCSPCCACTSSPCSSYPMCSISVLTHDWTQKPGFEESESFFPFSGSWCSPSQPHKTCCCPFAPPLPHSSLSFTCSLNPFHSLLFCPLHLSLHHSIHSHPLNHPFPSRSPFLAVALTLLIIPFLLSLLFCTPFPFFPFSSLSLSVAQSFPSSPPSLLSLLSLSSPLSCSPYNLLVVATHIAILALWQSGMRHNKPSISCGQFSLSTSKIWSAEL